VIDACAASVISCQVVAVISNNRESGALQQARAAGIPAYHLSSRTHPDPAALDAAICEALERHRTDLIVLAGYMKPVGSGHRAVLAAGDSKTGASVHVVTEEYDAGPLIAQREVPVEPADTPETLAERVQASERRLLVEVLGRIAEGRLRLPA